jgi:hypothetical protein
VLLSFVGNATAGAEVRHWFLDAGQELVEDASETSKAIAEWWKGSVILLSFLESDL